MSFTADRQPRLAADPLPGEGREEILRELRSDGFATKLREIVRRAIGAEIQRHKEAGRTLPVAPPADVKARMAGG